MYIIDNFLDSFSPSLPLSFSPPPSLPPSLPVPPSLLPPSLSSARRSAGLNRPTHFDWQGKIPTGASVMKHRYADVC